MRTRPGVDRLQVNTLRASILLAQRAAKKHLVTCDKCIRAGGNIRGRCSAWWAYARVIHNGQRTLRKYDSPDYGEQQTLPGMDNL